MKVNPINLPIKKESDRLFWHDFNPLMPVGNYSYQFFICCPRDCVSRYNGGTRGAPIMPRDAFSQTANVERTGRHKWVNYERRNGVLCELCVPREIFHPSIFHPHTNALCTLHCVCTQKHCVRCCTQHLNTDALCSLLYSKCSTN